MQTAYDKNMEKAESPRRKRRRENLIRLLNEFGGPTQVALESGTPKSHFSALVAGRRGVGDELAQKLEETYSKPPGWFDYAVEQVEVEDTDKLRETLARSIYRQFQQIQDSDLALAMAAVQQALEPFYSRNPPADQ